MTMPPPPPAAQPWKPASRRDFWLKGPGLIVWLIGAALAVAIPLTLFEKANVPTRGAFAVQVLSCKVDSSGNATVGLAVTNNSGRELGAAVDVEYRDQTGMRLDTDTAYIHGIAPGDTARGEEMTHLDAGASTITCQAVAVRAL